MITIFLRSIILYLVVVIMLRLMGKRQMSELQAYEFVLTLMIADLASAPISSINVPLLYGIIPIITLFLMHCLFSFIIIKIPAMRAFISGRPNIVISKGQIDFDELKKTQYTLHDLLEQMRSKNQLKIEDIEYAILENNGNLSVIPKKSAAAPSASDLGVEVAEIGLPRPLIMDGVIDRENLSIFNKNEDWLNHQIALKGYKSIKEILIFMLDEQENVFIQGKNPRRKRRLL